MSVDWIFRRTAADPLLTVFVHTTVHIFSSSEFQLCLPHRILVILSVFYTWKQWRSQGGTWVHLPPSYLENSICLRLLGASTPLRDFRPLGPLCCPPRSKFLATPLLGSHYRLGDQAIPGQSFLCVIDFLICKLKLKLSAINII